MILQFALFVFGLLLGIGINYLADVLPANHKFIHPVCLSCGNEYHLTDYLLQRSCYKCGKRRSIRNWIVVLCMSVAGILMVNFSLPEIGLWISLILFGFFVLVTVIDIEHRLILHMVSLAGVVLGFGVGWQLHGFTATIIGGVAGFGLMLLMYFLGFVFLRISGRIRNQEIDESEAIGFGDVNLSGIIGLILGWPGIIAGLVLAILLAGVASILYLVWMVIRKGYTPNLSLPYGPFLAASGVLLLYVRPLFF